MDLLETVLSRDSSIKLFKKALLNKTNIIDFYSNQNAIKYSNSYVIETSKINPKNDSLDTSILIKILEGYGLKRSRDTKINHLFGMINEDFYETNFLLLNNFQNKVSFLDKFNLYFNLQMYFPTHYNLTYPHSFMLTNELQWENIKNKVHIARPIGGASGGDIINIHNSKTLEDAKKLLMTKYNDLGISITEYITNPMLFKNKKMHVRGYMLFTLINNNFKSYFLEYGEIRTARNDYKNADWNNNDIHDTHERSTISKGLIFPNDLYNNTTPIIKNKDECQIIYNNICNCIKYISKIASANVFNFSNAKNTYEVYGIDILIKDDLSVFIMEVNGRNVSYVSTPDLLLKKYFEWIDNVVIKPCLFPNLEIIQTPSNTPIYDVIINDY